MTATEELGAVMTLEEESEGMTAAAEEHEDTSIDVDIEDMVWEVEDEPTPVRASFPETEPEPEENYSEEIYEEPDGYYADEPYRNYRYGRRAARAVNKHLFTWVFSFICGMYGVDRIIRGQTALGVLKLLTFGGLGFWYLADLIVAFSKSYIGEYSDSDDLLFDDRGRYTY